MVNKVILLGRLGKDPVVRRTANNVAVASFSIATSEKYKDKDGNKQEKTEWHNIVMWNALAETAEKYLKKGGLVYLEGKMTTRSYEQDGVTKYTTEIVVNNMQLMGDGSASNANRGEVPLPPEPENMGQKTEKTQTNSSNTNTVNEVVEDDLPF